MLPGEEHQPRFLVKTTGFIVGLTALILAIGGLIAAANGVFGSNSASTSSYDAPSSADPIATQNTDVLEDDANAAIATDDASTTNAVSTTVASSLPLRYSKPNGYLEFLDNRWVETDQVSGATAYFDEISRNEGMTVTFDSSRQMYLRWPNDGGTAQWSYANPLNWTDLYIVTPA